MVPIFGAMMALVVVVPPCRPLCQRALLTHRAVRAEIKLSILEQTKTGGFDLWNALAEPFAAVRLATAFSVANTLTRTRRHCSPPPARRHCSLPLLAAATTDFAAASTAATATEISAPEISVPRARLTAPQARRRLTPRPLSGRGRGV